MAAHLPERGTYLDTLPQTSLQLLLRTLRLPPNESASQPTEAHKLSHEAALARLPANMSGPHNLFQRALARTHHDVNLCQMHSEMVHPQVICALGELVSDETLLYSDVFRRWKGIEGRRLRVLEEWLVKIDLVAGNWFDRELRGPLRPNVAGSGRELASGIPGSSSKPSTNASANPSSTPTPHGSGAAAGSSNRLTQQATADKQYRVSHGCEACILSLIGGHPELLIALLASVHGRCPKAGRDPPDARMYRILRLWIRGRDDEKRLVFEGSRLGKVLEWTREVIDLGAEREVGGWLADALGGVSVDKTVDVGKGAVGKDGPVVKAPVVKAPVVKGAPAIKPSHTEKTALAPQKSRPQEKAPGTIQQRSEQSGNQHDPSMNLSEEHLRQLQGQLHLGLQEHSNQHRHRPLHGIQENIQYDEYERDDPLCLDDVPISVDFHYFGQDHPNAGLKRYSTRVEVPGREDSDSGDSQDGLDLTVLYSMIDHPAAQSVFRYPCEYPSPPPSPSEQRRDADYPAPLRIEKRPRNVSNEHGLAQDEGPGEGSSVDLSQSMASSPETLTLNGPTAKTVSPAVRAALDAPPRPDPRLQVQKDQKRSYRKSFTGLIGPAQKTSAGTHLHALDQSNKPSASASRGSTRATSQAMDMSGGAAPGVSNRHTKSSLRNDIPTPVAKHTGQYDHRGRPIFQRPSVESNTLATTYRKRDDHQGRLITRRSSLEHNTPTSTRQPDTQAPQAPQSTTANQTGAVTRRPSHESIASFSGILGPMTVRRDGTAQHIFRGAPPNAGLLDRLAMTKTMLWDNERSHR